MRPTRAHRDRVQRAIRKAIEGHRRGNKGMVLTIAFDYGGRRELIDAVERVRAAHLPGDPRRRSTNHLYLPELPPVDVLVRTSGERRVSNFLLWQSAGAAVYFSPTNWPEFDVSRARPGAGALLMAGDVDGAVALLAAATAALPAAEDRPGQREMARLVATAFANGDKLVVQAGTGTGKSLAYLTPAIAAAAAAAGDQKADDDPAAAGRRRVVVVTATKALQDQLATKDLPSFRCARRTGRFRRAEGTEQLPLPAAARGGDRRRSTAARARRRHAGRFASR